MKHQLLLLIFFPFFTFCTQNVDKKGNDDLTTTDSETTGNKIATYYLIRHAEKDRSNPDEEDPSLNIEGLKRAQRWATYFDTIHIDQVYVTDYLRTQQTVANIAQEKMVTPILYDPHNVDIDKFLNETRGKTILVAGHSNTIPKLVNALLGNNQFEDMKDNDNSTLFKVIIDGSNKKVDTTTVE